MGITSATQTSSSSFQKEEKFSFSFSFSFAVGLCVYWQRFINYGSFLRVFSQGLSQMALFSLPGNERPLAPSL